MSEQFVNIHTHRPTGQDIELRTVGIHPWDAGKIGFDSLVPLPDDVQAIGEIGLDFASKVGREEQLALFRSQLELACERGLPVVLHCVRAFEEVMHELSLRTPRAVIFHGFIGSPEQAQRATAKGYYLSFGLRTFTSPKSLRALCATPLTQLFVETDDEETPIEEMYMRVAKARGITPDELKRATIGNYERIFIQN